MERGDGLVNITAPATEAARTWQGWGTALKPAFEPVVVARKPLIGTVAANVLAHGTGALNVDGCRIGMSEADRANIDGRTFVGRNQYANGKTVFGDYASDGTDQVMASHPQGRWPANVVLDESQAAELNRQSGVVGGGVHVGFGPATTGYAGGARKPGVGFDDVGGASRFFYVAKAPTAERPREDGIAHPTVKPLDLMRWLVRLVTPPGGTVLEPFAGSGTTAEACIIEGFQCIAIEREADYLPLIVQRITKPIQPNLFGGEL
jgi:site-specific DNA-methyltransferase (adenine-specific)